MGLRFDLQWTGLLAGGMALPLVGAELSARKFHGWNACLNRDWKSLESHESNLDREVGASTGSDGLLGKGRSFVVRARCG